MKTERYFLGDLPDEALVGVNAVIALGPYGRSKFYAEVKAGRAPQPVMTAPRCTRWRLGDLRAWLNELAGGAGVGRWTG